MKFTKLVHSCLLIEADGVRIMVDPGNYSFSSGIVSEEHLTNLDYVAVTHVHPDHLDEDFAKKIKLSSPNAKWYGPAQVCAKLTEWGIESSSSSRDPIVRFVESSHAELEPWFSEQPEHTSFKLFDKVLIGGDCHTLESSEGAEVFALAINGGPWEMFAVRQLWLETCHRGPSMFFHCMTGTGKTTPGRRFTRDYPRFWLSLM